ncbi:MAG: porin, partial [Sphingomonas sp.]
MSNIGASATTLALLVGGLAAGGAQGRTIAPEAPVIAVAPPQNVVRLAQTQVNRTPVRTPDTAATSSATTAPEGSQASHAHEVPTIVPPPPAADDLAAQTAHLQAQIEALQTQIDAMKKQMRQATPTFKGAPQWANDDGFSFKPRGFAQFDAGHVSTPGPVLNGTVGGLNYNNLGWNARSRRLVLGAEGTLPGGFGYKVEFNYTQATIDYEDLVITYHHDGSPWQVTVGNFFPLSGFDSMTSSRLGSFLERSIGTDAFSLNRRVGAAVGYQKGDLWSITAGLFGQEVNNVSFARTGWQASARGVYSPKWGDAQMHFGTSYQRRTAPRDAQNVQYRARPFTQLTDQRFIDTGAIAADGDDLFGIEFAAIFKRLHVTGEAQKAWVRGYRPGRAFGANDGVANAAFYAGNPGFLNAYAEAGFYLTGETRGYKGGKWERTKVLHPVTDGGVGAIQLNGRVEYTDLTDGTGD